MSYQNGIVIPNNAHNIISSMKHVNSLMTKCSCTLSIYIYIYHMIPRQILTVLLLSWHPCIFKIHLKQVHNSENNSSPVSLTNMAEESERISVY